MRRPAEFSRFPAELAVPFGPFRAVVRHIVDGDTIDVLVDVGFNDYLYRTVRLAGIDAPEKNRTATREAGLAATEHLLLLLPPGSPVLLITDPDPDSFGRYIATVFMAGDVNVNDAMVEAGHAVFRTYD